jgi:DNA-binding response OmpR family regulator
MIRTVDRCRCCGSLELEGLVLDRTRGKLAFAGSTAHLTPGQTVVAAELLAAGGGVVSLRRFESAIWGGCGDGGPETAHNVLRVYIHRVRDALVEVGAPIVVEVVSRRGYRLAAAGDASWSEAERRAASSDCAALMRELEEVSP